ncbi:MAG: hypothetical protein IPL46_30405 [Saprospiraceae bacterium]|nr:hypothetical protein [Saprospiraceae bacterium]
MQWSHHYGDESIAFQDPYCLRVHASEGLWFFNCFIFNSGRKASWIGGSAIEDPSPTLEAAQKRAILVMKDHQKANR